MKSGIIAAGLICLDVTPAFECGPQHRFGDILAPGKLVKVGNAQFHPGGTVSNVGLAMARLGADVKFMGKVGDDAFGTMLLSELDRLGASEGMIVVPGQETSYSIVLAIPGIDRLFLHHTGANDTFTADDINYDCCRSSQIFHFGYPPLMAEMYRNEGRELTELYRRVRACGCLTSLDMAAIDEKSEAAKADWEGILTRTLPHVDFFLPSIEELMFMLDRPRYDELLKEADGRDMIEVISISKDVAPLGEKLLSMGASVVLIKCGALGFYYKTDGKEAFALMEKRSGLDFSTFSEKEGFEESYVPEKIVSGTGAGDTTIAAFLTAISKGYGLETCLHYAAGTGACCVAAADSVSGLKSFEELQKLIDAGWGKNILSDRNR